MATCLSWIVEVVWFFRSAASTVGFCLTCLTKFLRVEHGRSLQCSHLLTSIARLRSKYARFCCSFELATLRLMWKGLNLDTSQNDGYRQFRFNLPLAHIASQVVNGASHGHASLRCADPEDSMVLNFGCEVEKEPKNSLYWKCTASLSSSSASSAASS